MATYYIDVTRPDDSGNGLTLATAKKTFEAVTSLLVDGDSVLFVTSDYSHAPVAARTISKNVTIGAYNPVFRPTINLAALPRWLVNTGAVTLQDLLITGAISGTNNRAIEFNGSPLGTMQRVDFIDNYKHLYAYNCTKIIMDSVRFLGCTNTNVTTSDVEIYNCGPSAENATILNNIVHAPSKNNAPLALQLRGATHHTKVNNVLLCGSVGSGLSVYDATHTVTGRNLISFGHGVASPTPAGLAFGGSGQASDIDYSAISGFVSKANTFSAGYAVKNPNGTSKILGIKKYPRKGYMPISIDDTGAYFTTEGQVGIYDLIPLLAEYGLKITWFVTAYNVGASAATAMGAWLSAGHEIGCHGYSHSNITHTTAMTVVKAGQTITVAITRPDEDDFTTWSGAVTVSGSEPIAVTNTTTFAQLKTALESIGCAVGAFASEFSGDVALASCLDNVAGTSINSAYALQLNLPAYRHVEIVESKRMLESTIRAIEGFADYSIVSWGSPYTYSNQAAADVLKDSGYMSGRVLPTDLATAETHNLSPVVKCAPYLNRDLNIGNMSPTSAQPATEERVNGVITTILSAGSVMGFFFHKETFSEANLRAFFDMVMKFVPAGLVVGTQKAIWEEIRSVGVQTVGDGTGKAERWHVVTTEDADYHLLKGSPCIRAGVDVGLTTDADGNTIPTGAGFDIGPYFYRPEVDAGFSPWCKCDSVLPLSAQPCKSHALPIGTGKITVFDGVASQAQIEEAK